MNRATVRRLNRINADFYREHADDFSRTRSRPWGGWQKAFDALATPRSRPLSILDVGCGNGRLASSLAERFERVEYFGLDSSEPLLEQARARVDTLEGVDGRLHRIDLSEELPSRYFTERRFDLVTAFGLFHHLPGYSLRQELLADLARLTEPSGLLAAGFWQFGAHERFRQRFLDWQAFNRADDEPVDVDQLESGDHLLAWGDGEGAVRYCHWADPGEVTRLIEGAGLVAGQIYEADGANGQLNLYALIRSSPCA